jgi:hypothetical protein
MIRYHFDIEQGSEEWHALRCGILTASEMKLIMTQGIRPASNDKERAHLLELLGQRRRGVGLALALERLVLALQFAQGWHGPAAKMGLLRTPTAGEEPHFLFFSLSFFCSAFIMLL